MHWHLKGLNLLWVSYFWIYLKKKRILLSLEHSFPTAYTCLLIFHVLLESLHSSSQFKSKPDSNSILYVRNSQIIPPWRIHSPYFKLSSTSSWKPPAFPIFAALSYHLTYTFNILQISLFLSTIKFINRNHALMLKYFLKLSIIPNTQEFHNFKFRSSSSSYLDLNVVIISSLAPSKSNLQIWQSKDSDSNFFN